MLSAKIFYYVLMGVVLMAFLTELGFSLGPLLGAAGIVGVALWFCLPDECVQRDQWLVFNCRKTF